MRVLVLVRVCMYVCVCLCVCVWTLAKGDGCLPPLRNAAAAVDGYTAND